MGWNNEIPVDIELLVDKLGIRVVPEINLTILDLDSFISKDLKTIFISSPIFDNEIRCRFSVAHELGHARLHKEFLESMSFNSIIEWKKCYQSLEEKITDRIEKQASIFASFILMPTSKLEGELKKYFRENLYTISKKEDLIKNCTDLITREIVSSEIAVKLGQIFYVSHSAMKWRLYYAQETILKVIENL